MSVKNAPKTPHGMPRDSKTGKYEYQAVKVRKTTALRASTKSVAEIVRTALSHKKATTAA